ncbi:hypothetical protein PVAND_013716 [Polypedilum vanderplanki]|uniref:Uncharacterized protein n=1 Tax=Polypedilum vanderplanki TaxID=319348 RepID=A0A9J6CRH0_POLVA|nr:hypothetical protein PVAND_013716 [Polypedilum vanderplanki]
MNRDIIITLLFLWCSFFLTEDVNGMFEAILTHGESIHANNEKWDNDGVKIKRFNRTAYVITGSFQINIDYANECDLLCVLYKKSGNEYKLLPYKFGPKNLCSFVVEEELFYPAFLETTKNFPPLGTCDFKKGKYEFENYMPDLSKVPPVFESGDYMVECQALKNKELINGYKIYGQVFNYADAKSGVPAKPKTPDMKP